MVTSRMHKPTGRQRSHWFTVDDHRGQEMYFGAYRQLGHSEELRVAVRRLIKERIRAGAALPIPDEITEPKHIKKLVEHDVCFAGSSDQECLALFRAHLRGTPSHTNCQINRLSRILEKLRVPWHQAKLLDLENALSRLVEERQLRPGSRKAYRQVLRHFSKVMQKNGDTSDRAYFVRPVPVPEDPETTRRPFLPHEEELLMHHLEGEVDGVPAEHRQLIYRVAQLTALRSSEVAGLVGADLQGDTLTIRAPEAKNGQRYTFPLPPELAADLHALRRSPRERLLDCPPTPKRVTQMIQVDCENLGIHNNSDGRVGFHSWRKSFATRLHDAGVGIDDIRRMGRWSTVTMVMRYIKTTDTLARDRAILAQLSKATSSRADCSHVSSHVASRSQQSRTDTKRAL